MKTSLREILVRSHIAAIAIASLLLGSLDSAFKALWDPLLGVLRFLFTAVAILDIPYISSTLTIPAKQMLIVTFTYLYGAIANFSAAWLLSCWIYGVGPIPCMMSYGDKLSGRPNA
jgi:small basic protein